MNDTEKNLVYLLSCAVNEFTPDRNRVQAMDLEKLYRLATFHSVRAAICIALKRAGIEDKPFDQAYKKAVRKNIYLDVERTAILSEWESAEQVCPRDRCSASPLREPFFRKARYCCWTKQPPHWTNKPKSVCSRICGA